MLCSAWRTAWIGSPALKARTTSARVTGLSQVVVEGNSAQPGETGMTQARDEARAKAAGAGATTVVTDREWQTPDVASAAVKAYDCT